MTAAQHPFRRLTHTTSTKTSTRGFTLCWPPPQNMFELEPGTAMIDWERKATRSTGSSNVATSQSSSRASKRGSNLLLSRPRAGQPQAPMATSTRVAYHMLMPGSPAAGRVHPRQSLSENLLCLLRPARRTVFRVTSCPPHLLLLAVCKPVVSFCHSLLNHRPSLMPLRHHHRVERLDHHLKRLILETSNLSEQSPRAEGFAYLKPHRPPHTTTFTLTM
jgi:hypothetical protein